MCDSLLLLMSDRFTLFHEILQINKQHVEEPISNLGKHESAQNIS